jgi:hypothetical protein
MLPSDSGPMSKRHASGRPFASNRKGLAHFDEAGGFPLMDAQY